MTPALNVYNLGYAYRRRYVLNNVNFCAEQGSFFVIIGPNGSGKTTLMKLLSGILKPQTGTIHISGKPIESFSSKRLARLIAFVPQTQVSHFPFTVRETVLTGRFPYLGMLGIGTPYDFDIAEQALSFAGITHLADRRISDLSGGEQQRVWIAKAIAQEPQILLLDEPTAFLDLAHQIQIMDVLEKLRQEKQITIVMVSHDLNLAAMYGGCLLLLHNGTVADTGTPETVLNFSSLEKAYGCVLLVDKNPLGNFPRIIPVPGRFVKPHDLTQ